MTPSLTTRLSLLFALTTAAVLFALGTMLEHAVELHFQDMDRQDLNGKLTLVRDVADAVRSAAGADLRAQLDTALVGHPELVLRIRDADGRTLFVRGLLPGADRDGAAPAADASARQWLQWQVGDRPFRGLSAPLNGPASNTSTGTVLLGMDISHHRTFMTGFRHLLVLSIIMAAATAAVLGWIATRAGLRPLRRITALASELSTERLDARLPESGVPAEIQVLVDAFNAMLARLDDSFRRISEFSADVAHELRTPIANLTLQTQVALQGSRDPEAYRELLYSSLEEYERLGQLIGDMLYLAQADHGLLRPTVEEVKLGEQVEALFDYFDALAEDEGIGLVLDGNARVQGDPLMLRRALSNLLSNAIRHTPRGCQVHVRLRDDPHQAHVSVENPGPALDADRLHRLFERFHRDPAIRPGDAEGAGLGLAIVKAIVTAHGGAVSASSTGQGLRFEMTFPRRRPT